MEVSLNYGFDEDSLLRLQKDLNHLLTHLDSQNVRKLITEQCEIKSENNETRIDGALIEMYDYSTDGLDAPDRLRLRMGYDGSNFVFNMWGSVETTDLPSSNISPTISLNALTGNAIFSGSIDTDESIYIGNNIFLGITGSTVNKGLYFNSSDPTAGEEEGTSDMKSALYTENTTGNFKLNLNSTSIIDIISYQGLFLQRNADTNVASYEGIQVKSTNFNIHYFPHLVLGDVSRYNVWSGFYNDSTSAIVPKGYIDKSVHWNLSDSLKSYWCEQGKIIDEFDSTDWTPNSLCSLEVQSSNKVAYTTGCLLLRNTSTSAGDMQFYKWFDFVDLRRTNSGRTMSTDNMFYVLFYLYDLSKINTLSTKSMQIELASSSNLGNKYRYYLDNSTSETILTTGWNAIFTRLDNPYSYSGTFASTSLRYARLSFESKANSTGAIASIQSLGIIRKLPNYTTTPNVFPRYDDLNGGYREAVFNIGARGNWLMRRISSTGISIAPFRALMPPSVDNDLLLQYGYAYNLEYSIGQVYYGDIKMQYRIKIKNKNGAFPFLGGIMVWGNLPVEGSNNRFGVVASSNVIKLHTIYNSTQLEDWTNRIAVNYNDIFDITIWKEDPPINSTYSQDTQITACVEKVGTTEMCTFAYTWKAKWKDYAYTTVISAWEEDAPTEIMEVEVSRR